MHIHFICRGNVYRSRLAEAYAKSITNKNKEIVITSSGVEADLALNDDTDLVIIKLLKAEGIDKFMKSSWTQTKQGHIDNADTIVFMSETVYQDAQKFLDIPKEKTIVWHIPDKNGIYPEIKKQVNNLLRAS